MANSGATIGDLIVKIGADVADLKTAMTDVTNTVQKTTSEIDRTSMSTGRMASAVALGTAAWDLFKQGIGIATEFIGSSIEAAIEAESKMSLVRETVIATSGSYEEAAPIIEEFSNKMAQMGRDDEDAALSLAQLHRATGDWTQAQRLATLASDLMASGIGDIQSNTKALSQLMMGDARLANKAFKLGLDESATSADVLDALEKRVTRTTDEWGNTTEGRIAKAQVGWENLKENIGKAFLPTVDLVLQQGNELLGQTNDQVEKQDFLAQAIYALSNIFMGAFYVVLSFGDLLGTLGTVFVTAATTAVAFAKDVWNAMTDIGKIGSQVFSALSKAIHGDFEGAMNTMQDVVNKNFSATVSTFQVGAMAIGYAAIQGSNNWAKAMSFFGEAWNRTGFKAVSDMSGATDQVEANFGDLANSIDRTKDKTVDAMKELRDSVKKSFDDIQDELDNAYNKQEERLNKNETRWKKHKREIKNELKDLQKTHNSTVEHIGEQINQLNTAFDQGNASRLADFKDNVANMVVDHEDKSQKIQAQIAEEEAKGTSADQKKLDSLRASLAQEQDLIAQASAIAIQYNADVTTAREVAHMSDSQRALYEYNQATALAKQQHDQKLAELNKSLDDENASYTEHYNKLKDKLSYFRNTYDEKMDNINTKTKQTLKDIKKEFIDTFKDVSDALSAGALGDLFTKNSKKIAKGKLTSDDFLDILGIQPTGSRQLGGKIYETGLYMMHAGEEVIPARMVNQAGGMPGQKSVSVQMTFTGPVNVRSQQDLEAIKQEVRNWFSRDIEMSSYGAY